MISLTTTALWSVDIGSSFALVTADPQSVSEIMRAIVAAFPNTGIIVAVDVSNFEQALKL